MMMHCPICHRPVLAMTQESPVPRPPGAPPWPPSRITIYTHKHGQCRDEQPLAALDATAHALQAELDAANLNMLRYIAFVLAGDETADAQLAADRVRQENADLSAALEQARRDLDRLAAGAPDVIGVDGHDAKYWWDEVQRLKGVEP